MLLQREKVVTPLADMPIGHSFFYPTYDEKRVEAEIRAEAKRLKIRVSVVVGIERGVFGLRVFRVT